MNADSKYRIVAERKIVYAVYGEDGEFLAEHDTETRALNNVKRRQQCDELRSKALATPGSTLFHIGDRVRFKKEAPKYGSSDIPAEVVDIFYELEPPDRGGDFPFYRLKWDNGVVNTFPHLAFENVMELESASTHK